MDAGRARKSGGGPLEGTFDHGEEGYGLWLDPAVQDDPVYAEHWAGHRPVTVTVEAERIVITRVGTGDDRRSRRQGRSLSRRSGCRSRALPPAKSEASRA